MGYGDKAFVTPLHGTVYFKLHCRTQQIKQTRNYFCASCHLGIFTFHMFYCSRKHAGVPNQALFLKYNWSLPVFTNFTQIKALNCRNMHSHIFRSRRVDVLALFISHTNWLVTWKQQSHSVRCCPAGLKILEFCA